MARWVRIALAAAALAFLIGYFSPRVAVPDLCKIYGNRDYRPRTA